MKKLKLTIEGMHCASCATNIERSLRRVPGVKDVSVSVLTNKSFIEADDAVSEENLKKAISAAGTRYKLLKAEQVN